MMKKMQERVTKATQELERVQAICDVYEILKKQYNSEFCIHLKDENDEYMYDENYNPIYEEKGDSEEEFCNYPWYDGKRALNARQAFRDILKYMETMK